MKLAHAELPETGFMNLVLTPDESLVTRWRGAQLRPGCTEKVIAPGVTVAATREFVI